MELSGVYKVYKHTFENGKVYIGITKQDPQRRWESGGRGYDECPRMRNAIKKYGWENVKHEIVADGLTKQQAEEMEVSLISFYQSNKAEYGYNIENGGNACGTHSDETRAKISKGNKGLKKKPCSTERKRYLSGKFTGENNPFYGRKHSEITKYKISESRLGNSWAKRSAVIQYTVLGEFVAEYETVTDAHNKTGVSMAGISLTCSGKNKKAGGFVWKYKEKEHANQR